jgi:lytic murein transglycosylase
MEAAMTVRLPFPRSSFATGRLALRAAAAAAAIAAGSTAMAQAPAAPVVPDAPLDTAACLARLRPGAPAAGVAVADFDRWTANAQLLETTVSSARAQPEGRETWWDYIAKTVDDERVAAGQDILGKFRPQLAAVSQNYAVDPEALVAIFGIETNFGTQIGKTDVLNAWLTRACTEKNPLWKSNAYASVKLLRDGVVQPESFIGSWSGAFGMTQFIPTSFYELAADGDGDNRIDLYSSMPDALASTANHLRKRRAQWQHGVPPVIEVKLPAAIAGTMSPDPSAEIVADGDRRTLGQWAAQGVTRVDGQSLQSAGAERSAYIVAPTGSRGPVFLATANFDAILHYNQSKKYGLAVSLLTNRLQGEPAIATPWPTDDPGLSRLQIRELQTWLIKRGHDVGIADGIPGLRTRDAVKVEQTRLGLPQDGRVGRKIYDALAREGA